MASKSVSINNIERVKIIDQIKTQYAKLAVLKHPNPNFHKELSKTIYKKYLNVMAEKLTPEIAPFIHYENVFNFAKAIEELKIADVQIKKLDIEMHSSNNLLSTTRTLAGFEPSEVVIPNIFTNNKKVVPFPFTQWGQSKYSADKIVLDENTLTNIQEYNDQMVKVYSELSAQLDNLLGVIKKCKSTKMFEDKLPNLVSLYPESIHKKLRAKNDKQETELTEEQQSLLDATASLAAAALLEDK